MWPNCLSPGSACVRGHVTLPPLSPHPSCLQLPLSLDPVGPRPLALPPSSSHISLLGQQGSEARVIRVSIDNDHGNLYRSILVREGLGQEPAGAALPPGAWRSHLTTHLLFPAHQSGQGSQCGAASPGKAQCGSALGPGLPALPSPSWGQG